MSGRKLTLCIPSRPERGLNGGQCGACLRAIGTAGLRHIGPPAAALAAQRLGALADEIDCVESGHEVVGAAHNNAGLAILGDADYGAGPPTASLFSLVGPVREALPVL